MIDSVIAGLSGLAAGVIYLFTQGGPNVIMLVIAATLLYLGVKKDVEPLLLVPIGFGCVLVNIPLSDLMDRAACCASSTTWASPTRCSRCSSSSASAP